MSNEAISFLHDASAHRDERMLELRMRGGPAWYGIYWMVIEMLREASDYSLQTKRKAAIAYALAISLDEFEKFYAACVELGLLVEEGNEFYSPSLHKRMEKYESKKASTKAAAQARWNNRNTNAQQIECDSNASALPTQSESNPCYNTTQLNTNQNNSNKTNTTQPNAFAWVETIPIPPSLDENARDSLRRWAQHCARIRKSFGEFEAESLLYRALKYDPKRFSEAVHHSISSDWVTVDFSRLPEKNGTGPPKKQTPTDRTLESIANVKQRLVNHGKPRIGP